MTTKLEIRAYGAPVISGSFTNEHAASSEGMPVFVADDGRVIRPSDIKGTYGDWLLLPTKLSEPIDRYENTVPVGKSGKTVETLSIEPLPEIVAWLQDYIVATLNQPCATKWTIPEMQRGQALLRRCEEATGRKIALNVAP
jgi:hypothetical protein